MKKKQPSEREFVEGLNATERELKPHGFEKYEAGMRQYLLTVEGRTKRPSIKLEMRRRVLERIFSFACISRLGGRAIVGLLSELEEVGFARFDKRVEMAGLLGVWLTCARDSDQAAIDPSDRFLAATEGLLKKRRPSQLRSDCEAAVADSRVALDGFRSRQSLRLPSSP